MNFLYLNSETMGSGDDDLGQLLLKNFLRKIVDGDHQVDAVACTNSAVRLCCEGSPVLALMEALQRKGAQIACCRTCLDHFELRDSLRVGEVGTMDQCVATMMSADRVIRP